MSKPGNNIVLYQDENGITQVSVRFSNEDVWLAGTVPPTHGSRQSAER
jgi:hypothetical protein